VKKSLSALPCFIHVEKISSITSGLSQKCFKVYADNKVYFAKTITNKTEAQVAVIAAKKGLSPTVFYHDKYWLITNFIDADNLSSTTIEQAKKVSYAICLMVSCHQLNAKPAELAPKNIIAQLINKDHYSTQKKAQLMHLGESIISSLIHSKNLVCCHGDINFSNVLIDQKQNTCLVDYECACIAPAEYDLAMFIAVNNLAEDKIPIIIKQYKQQMNSVEVDIKMLYNYLAFSYFINSLWYFNVDQHESSSTLKRLQKQQWKKFICLNASTNLQHEHLAKPL